MPPSRLACGSARNGLDPDGALDALGPGQPQPGRVEETGIHTHIGFSMPSPMYVTCKSNRVAGLSENRCAEGLRCAWGSSAGLHTTEDLPLVITEYTCACNPLYSVPVHASQLVSGLRPRTMKRKQILCCRPHPHYRSPLKDGQR